MAARSRVHPRAETASPAMPVAVAAARASDRWRGHEQQPPNCGEVAGATAAECTAISCCLPCVAVEVVVLAAVGVPVALGRRAVRAHRRRRSAAASKLGAEGELLADDGEAAKVVVWPAIPISDEVAELENEVWARFYGAGFWRSLSQRYDER